MKSGREIAYEVLVSVIAAKKYVNIALKEQTLVGADGNLATQIIYGTLQHYRYLNYQWEDLVVKQPKVSVAVLINMALFQHIHLDKVPDYAILSETVQLAKQVDQGRYSGFVNAILRKLFQRPLKEVVFENQLEALAIETSHPSWLAFLLAKQYGREVASAILHQNNVAPKLYGRIQQTSKYAQELPTEYMTRVDSELNIYQFGKEVLKSDAFLQGKLIIQDANSQKVAHFMEPKPHERILDMCSAPGTKAVHMADLMNNLGEIVAIDLHKHRCELIEQLSQKTNVSIIKPMVQDSTKLDHVFDENLFDAVLIDAPCSGLGVLRRKPDKKLTINPVDLDQLQVIQKQLLDQASRLVRVGGSITYATCTINKKENEKQIEGFLKRNPNFELLKEQLLLPHLFDADGFYMAKLSKKTESVLK